MDARVAPCAPDLAERVLEAFGLSRPPEPDAAGLDDLYGRWCTHVPFDNVQKRLYFAAGEEGPLPGSRPGELLETWLRHGTGGTCWAASEALASLLTAVGFSARRAAGTMLASPDARGPNHGTVVVELEGRDLLVDPSMLHQAPMPLDGSPVEGTVAIVGVRRQDGKPHIDWRPLHRPAGMPCRIDAVSVDATTFAGRHEATRAWSPFNHALSVRLNRAGSVVGFAMGEHVVMEAGGDVHTRRVEGDERVRVLVEELGMSEEVATRLPPDEPTPPPPGARAAGAAPPR